MIAGILTALNWFATSPLGRALGLVAAVLAGLATVFIMGKRSARETARREAAERTLREVKRYRHVQERVRRMSTDELRRELRDWSSR